MTTDTAHPDGPTPEFDLDELGALREAAVRETGYEWTAERVYDGVYSIDLHSTHPDSDSYGVGKDVRLPREVARFIVAAVNALPELVAEVRRLRSERDRIDRFYDESERQRDRLAETVARVEELASPGYPPPPPDERGAAGWRFAMEHIRAVIDQDHP